MKNNKKETFWAYLCSAPLVAFDFADRCIPNSVHGVHLLYKHECLPLVQLLVCRAEEL